jgi:hypothetical protein
VREMADRDLRSLLLSKIISSPTLMMRVQIDEATVQSYAELMLDGVLFPPPVVFWDGTQFILADGFHRCEAARHAGFAELLCDVRKGNQREALLFAVGANATHGLPRTDEDKRMAVDALLKDSEWVRWADAAIARHAGVSLPLVSKRRKKLVNAGTIVTVTERIRVRDGKEHLLDISKGGRSPSVPDPSRPDYVKHWLYFLVRFTPEQFKAWQRIVNLRTNKEVLEEAVDVVMRSEKEQAA